MPNAARRPVLLLLAFAAITAALTACAGRRPEGLGVFGGRLAACPDSPNCVSSDASPEDVEHFIAAFALTAPPGEAWTAASDAVSAMPRTRIVKSSDDYLHAEQTSRLMRYVDDLELDLRADARQIAVRSASRLGRGDMGVNRARVEGLRDALIERGVVGASGR